MVVPVDDRSSVRRLWFLFPVLLVIVAFIPILNNGFIGDDFVNLDRAEILKANPFFLYQIPPENFRTTLYVVFAILKTFAGYSSAVFYVFNILLHAGNVLMLGCLVSLLTRNSEVALAASAFFAVFANPQEAVMWLAGMPENLLACFMLATLILWVKDRPALAALTYAGALLSKESSVLIFALIPVVDWYRGKKPFRLEYLYIVVPTALFGLSFALTWKFNTNLHSGVFKFSPQAFAVLGRSLLRLLWPWFYIVLIVARVATGSWPRRRTVVVCVAGVAFFLLPYMFITYSPSLPSRNVYLASAALMAAFALWIGPLWRHRVTQVFIAVFIIFNVSYLWIRKDRQFEERAAPTTALLRALEGRIPQKTLILDFPYPYPEIAISSVHLLPGWTGDVIVVGKSREACPECRALKWNPRLEIYEDAPF